jgi:hypothetical protein
VAGALKAPPTVLAADALRSMLLRLVSIIAAIIPAGFHTHDGSSNLLIAFLIFT